MSVMEDVERKDMPIDAAWRDRVQRTLGEAAKAADFHRAELNRHEAVLRSAKAAMSALEEAVQANGPGPDESPRF